MAMKDAVAAIGELLALEVHSSRLAALEQMQHGEKTWGRVKTLFPGYVDLSEKAQTLTQSAICSIASLGRYRAGTKAR